MLTYCQDIAIAFQAASEYNRKIKIANPYKNYLYFPGFRANRPHWGGSHGETFL